MAHTLIDIITSPDPARRDASVDDWAQGASLEELLTAARELDAFRRASENLYHRVRALFFLSSLYRYHIPTRPQLRGQAMVPYHGYEHLLSRRFAEAIDAFLQERDREGESEALSSALATAYRQLAFDTLARQVRRSVRSVKGNQWMFRAGHPADHPLRIRRELLTRDEQGAFPILCEATPVRMDLTHSAWSDIFFLGMDYPQGARVLNISVDLGVHGRDAQAKPPISACLRVIDKPVLRLVSVDLKSAAEIDTLGEVFDFARDYLGLLKAALIASGLVPAGLEGSERSLADLLRTLVGPGLGLELVSSVNDIPKGSRLAVSTNLLAGLISVCMRATRQAESLEGGLIESERRLVLARALLGEWLSGSGGGWQDSGGVWPGMKLIRGVESQPGDPEHGVSRGRLMPQHELIPVSDELRDRLQASLVLVHGGLAQNVGPILEMVTEKYLLRSGAAWRARAEALGVLDDVLEALKSHDLRGLGAATTRNFFGPIQTIIPWASTFYTERLIEQARGQFGEDFWGFWMLGGMSGGGMGFMVDPRIKARAQEQLQGMMRGLKKQLEHALPFAMEPVVYDFTINPRGTWATLLHGEGALMPPGYYAMTAPAWLRSDPRSLAASVRTELARLSVACRHRPDMNGMVQTLFDQMLPAAGRTDRGDQEQLARLLADNGFDAALHEQVRSDLRSGRVGLTHNRLPPTAQIEDVRASDVIDTRPGVGGDTLALGERALRNGEVAVVTLAAGAGSRWTQGAGVVKALNPFARLGGRHRSFIEVHLAKSRRIGRRFDAPLPHVLTTSYLTHEPIAAALEAYGRYGYEGDLILSRGRSVGLRLVPMERDLRFAWEEMPQQVLAEQAQKMRQSAHAALIGWAKSRGEASDYTDNVPAQCLHPIGHFFELPNLLRNGTLRAMLAARPQLRTLMLHNIDTLGADADPAALGAHLAAGRWMSVEVITRKVEDRGGGLARVNGQVRLVEGLAMPREQDEFALTYYNTLTCWVDIDAWLALAGLTRHDLDHPAKVDEAVRAMSRRVPTYVTLKDVKKRWGFGQEDVFPVCQWEKLWGDMTAIPEAPSAFLVVPRPRGQQLKEPAQLDGWVRDGSAAYVESITEWE